MASNLRVGYKWVTRNGEHIVVIDWDFPYHEDENGNIISHNKELQGYTFSSVNEMEAMERDLKKKKADLEYNSNLGATLNREEKILDAQKTKQSKKPPRKGMKDTYSFGDTITLNEQNYKVVAKVKLDDKFAGYMVHDSNGNMHALTKFGDIQNNFPNKYRKL